MEINFSDDKMTSFYKCIPTDFLETGPRYGLSEIKIKDIFYDFCAEYVSFLHENREKDYFRKIIKTYNNKVNYFKIKYLSQKNGKTGIDHLWETSLYFNLSLPNIGNKENLYYIFNNWLANGSQLTRMPFLFDEKSTTLKKCYEIELKKILCEILKSGKFDFYNYNSYMAKELTTIPIFSVDKIKSSTYNLKYTTSDYDIIFKSKKKYETDIAILSNPVSLDNVKLKPLNISDNKMLNHLIRLSLKQNCYEYVHSSLYELATLYYGHNTKITKRHKIRVFERLKHLSSLCVEYVNNKENNFRYVRLSFFDLDISRDGSSVKIYFSSMFSSWLMKGLILAIPSSIVNSLENPISRILIFTLNKKRLELASKPVSKPVTKLSYTYSLNEISNMFNFNNSGNEDLLNMFTDILNDILKSGSIIDSFHIESDKNVVVNFKGMSYFET